MRLQKALSLSFINIIVLVGLLITGEGISSLVLVAWKQDLTSRPITYVDPYTGSKVRHEGRNTPLLGSQYAPNSLAEFYYLNDDWISPQGLYTDRFGFIHNGDPNRDLESPPKGRAKRLYIFGGSSLAGANSSSSNKRTIPAFMEQGLRKLSGQPDEVVNAGVGGYETWRELVVALNVSAGMTFDGMIFFDGRNDWFRLTTLKQFCWNNECAEDDKKGSTSFDGVREKIKRSSSYRLIYQIYKTIRPTTTTHPVVRIVDNGTTLPKDAFTIEPEQLFDDSLVNGFRRTLDFRQNAVKNFIANWRAMAGLCIAKKIPCVIALQPTLGYGEKPLTKYEDRYLTAIPFRNWSASQNAFYDEVRRRIPELRVEFSRYGIAFVDLSEIFKQEDHQVYLDSVHYLDFGNCVLGRALAMQWSKISWSAQEIRRNCLNEVGN